MATLDLSWNSIGPEGTKAIAEAIRASGSLATLYLTSNQIGDEGAKALAEAMCASGSLAVKTLFVGSTLRMNGDLKDACQAKA